MRSEKLLVLVYFEGCTFKGMSSLTIPRCAFLCVCGALSECVYFAEGHFTSGCLEMNGELISPTATSQSLHIYSPVVTSPQPGKQWHPCLLQMSSTESEVVKTGHVDTATKAQQNQIKSFNWVFLLVYNAITFKLYRMHRNLSFVVTQLKVGYYFVVLWLFSNSTRLAASSKRGWKLSMAACLMSWLGSGRWQKQFGISLDQPSIKAFCKPLIEVAALVFSYNIGQVQERMEQIV